MVHVPIIYIFWILQVRANPNMFAAFPPIPAEAPNYTHGVIVCIVVAILTLIVASITYRFIEVPSRKYLNKRFGRKETEAVNVISQTVLTDTNNR